MNSDAGISKLNRHTTMIQLVSALAICFSVGGAPPAGAQASRTAPVTEYVKKDVRIRMRDGVRLFTTIYAPRDTSTRLPVLMTRTPYSVAPYGPTESRAALGPGDNPRYAESGFIFVYQDVRGRYQSEGEFTETTPHVPMAASAIRVNESTDAYDTIEWLMANQPGNNGRVAIYGISYPGFYTTASCIDPHPALRACIPQAPIGDIGAGDDLFHNGAFLLAHNFGFYLRFARGPKARTLGPDPTYDVPDVGPDAYDFFLRQGPLSEMARRWLPPATAPRWQVLVQHPAYDSYWRTRKIAPHLTRMAPAMLVVGGWYDAEDLTGTLATYKAIQKNDASRQLTLVMGPWSHGGWLRGPGTALGNVQWSSHTAEFYRDSIEFPFVMHQLKDAPDPKLPNALVFRTGADQWDRLDAWPPRNSSHRSLFLRTNGVLAFEPPGANEGFSSYLSDPRRPVPVVGRIENQGMPADYMTADQRFAAQRPDVLVFESEPLTADLTISGAIESVLHVATTGTDADFVMKLIDVHPATETDTLETKGDRASPGYQQLIRGEPFRGRYRHNTAQAQAFVPLQPDSLRFVMPDINHTFRRGHRIMVQVQSTWFPHIDRNPQTFVPNIFNAKAADFQAATMRVYHQATRPSRIEFSSVR